MKLEQIVRLLAGLLVLAIGHSAAQSGYSYGRPDVGLSGVGATGIASTANTLQNPVRPLVSGFGGVTQPSAAAAPSAVPSGFAATNTGFGGVTGNPTTGFSPLAFGQATAQRTVAPAATNLLQTGNARQPQGTLPQRGSPQAGIYGQQGFVGSGRGGLTAASGSGAYSSDEYGGDGGGDFSAIPGVPGVDYPVYSQVPATNFDCALQPLPGYYSDVEAQCQVFHICALNRTYSFLCPNGTLFSQETLVCVWWNQYDCASAPSLYANNAYIYDYSKTGQPEGTQQQQTLAGGGRQQPNYPAVRTTATGGIYGTGGYNQQGVAASPITPATTSVGFPAAASRFQPNTGTGGTGSPLTSAFPTASSVATPSPFNINPTASLVGRGSLPTAVAVTAGGGQPTALGRTQYANTVPTTTPASNREYLPPRRP